MILKYVFLTFCFTTHVLTLPGRHMHGKCSVVINEVKLNAEKPFMELAKLCPPEQTNEYLKLGGHVIIVLDLSTKRVQQLYWLHEKKLKPPLGQPARCRRSLNSTCSLNDMKDLNLTSVSERILEAGKPNSLTPANKSSGPSAELGTPTKISAAEKGDRNRSSSVEEEKLTAHEKLSKELCYRNPYCVLADSTIGKRKKRDAETVTQSNAVYFYVIDDFKMNLVTSVPYGIYLLKLEDKDAKALKTVKSIFPLDAALTADAILKLKDACIDFLAVSSGTSSITEAMENLLPPNLDKKEAPLNIDSVSQQQSSSKCDGGIIGLGKSSFKPTIITKGMPNVCPVEDVSSRDEDDPSVQTTRLRLPFKFKGKKLLRQAKQLAVNVWHHLSQEKDPTFFQQNPVDVTAKLLHLGRGTVKGIIREFKRGSRFCNSNKRHKFCPVTDIDADESIILYQVIVEAYKANEIPKAEEMRLKFIERVNEKRKNENSLGNSIASATNSAPPVTNSASPPTNSAPSATNPALPATNSAAPATNSAPPATNSAPPAKASAPTAKNSAAPATNSAPPAKNSAAPATNSAPPAKNSVAPATISLAPVTNSAPPTTNSASQAKAAAPPAKNSVATATISSAPVTNSAPPTAKADPPVKNSPRPVANSALTVANSARPATNSAPTVANSVPVAAITAPSSTNSATSGFNSNDIKEYTCSPRSFSKILKKNGYRYGRINAKDTAIHAPYVIANRRKYLRRKKEVDADPNTVVYYQDETWLDSNARGGYGWRMVKYRTFQQRRDFGFASHKSSRGGRIVVLGAASKNGFVTCATEVYKVSKAKIAVDYHSNVNERSFFRWMRKLMTCLPKDKKNVIVFDNCPFHNSKDAPTSKDKKAVYLEWLKQKKKDGTPEIPDNLDTLNRPDLWKIVKNIKKKYVPFKLDELAKEFQVEILRLPQYSPELNPIEYSWAHLKNHVREKNKRQHIDDAVNLALKYLEEYPATTFQNNIQHVIKMENLYREGDEEYDNFVLRHPEVNQMETTDWDEAVTCDENSDNDDEMSALENDPLVHDSSFAD